MRDEITAAINAHGQWKQKLLTAIETGKSDVAPEGVEVDDKCAFGKWFHSLSGNEKNSEFYEEVKNLHANFHKAAAEVLRLALEGKKEEAKAKMALESEYSVTSSNLILILGRWSRSVNE